MRPAITSLWFKYIPGSRSRRASLHLNRHEPREYEWNPTNPRIIYGKSYLDATRSVVQAFCSGAGLLRHVYSGNTLRGPNLDPHNLPRPCLYHCQPPIIHSPMFNLHLFHPAFIHSSVLLGLDASIDSPRTRYAPSALAIRICT